MSVNGITNTAAYQYASSGVSNDTKKVADKNVEKTSEAKVAEDSGVVYEKSTQKPQKNNKNHKVDTATIQKLKADAEERTSQLKNLVEKLMLGQGNAIGTADDMWSFLRTGNFTVDEATKAQAQADIAEDGYWGVEQTSDRILDFAKALCGGDPDKIEEMRSAFEKGFKLAEKTWGGKLPDISQRTYDATMKKFDAWASESSKTTTE